MKNTHFFRTVGTPYRNYAMSIAIWFYIPTSMMNSGNTLLTFTINIKLGDNWQSNSNNIFMTLS